MGAKETEKKMLLECHFQCSVSVCFESVVRVLQCALRLSLLFAVREARATKAALRKNRCGLAWPISLLFRLFLFYFHLFS
jgi:hypothetical protein